MCPNMDWINFFKFFEMVWLKQIAQLHTNDWVTLALQTNFLPSDFNTYTMPHVQNVISYKTWILIFDTSFRFNPYAKFLEYFPLHEHLSHIIVTHLPLVHRQIVIVGLLKINRRNNQWWWIELIDFHCRIFWYFPECITKWIQFGWNFSHSNNLQHRMFAIKN